MSIKKLMLVSFIFLVTTSNCFARQYFATDNFTKTDVLKLVKYYYRLHDKKASASKYFKILADKDLFMLMGVPVTSKSQFSLWLLAMKATTMRVRHSIRKIKITPKNDGSYTVDSCIRYKGRTNFFIPFNNTDTIKWVIVDSPSGNKLLIKKYIVTPGCKLI